MSFSINTFQSHLNSGGIQKASLFNVDVTGPASIKTDTIRMRAFSAEIPGRTLSTTEYRVYGPLRKMAYAATYTDTRIEFLCTQGLEEKMFFEEWQHKVVGTHSHQPTAHTSAVGTGLQHNVGYYRDYAKGTIEIQLHTDYGPKSINVHKFHEVYPIGIAPMAVSWDSTELLKLAVTFAFHDYTVTDYPPLTDDDFGDDDTEAPLQPILL